MNKYSIVKALVVEDDFASRQYLTFMLKRLDMEFVAAESGESALAMVEDQNLDILLLDIALGPGIDGITLCEQLKQLPRFAEIPAVAITAFAKDHLNDFKRVGFNEYISKPYQFDQLKEILDKYLSG